MERILAEGPYTRGIIVVPFAIAQRWMNDLAHGHGERIELWDLTRLRDAADPDRELLETLDQLAAETILDGEAPRLAPLPSHTTPGRAIAERLRATQPGPEGWRAFEDGCYEAIRLLFGRELQNLVAQRRSDDGLNRMDLIGRIRSEPNTFWSIIANDFASRYVVFDAKNHTAAIGQDQINSTAKYLIPGGLRKVAILIAREGAAESARASSAGHLRHDGFLLLTISLSDLCGMLEGADAGEPPENLLFMRMDEALMTLNR